MVPFSIEYRESGVAHHLIEIEQLRSHLGAVVSRPDVMHVTKSRHTGACQPDERAFTWESTKMFIHVDF
jgi:hypothetical protein